MLPAGALPLSSLVHVCAPLPCALPPLLFFLFLLPLCKATTSLYSLSTCCFSAALSHKEYTFLRASVRAGRSLRTWGAPSCRGESESPRGEAPYLRSQDEGRMETQTPSSPPGQAPSPHPWAGLSQTPPGLGHREG